MPAATITTGMARISSIRAMQPPQAGHAHVRDLERRLAVEPQRARRLARHRHVRGAGAHDGGQRRARSRAPARRRRRCARPGRGRAARAGGPAGRRGARHRAGSAAGSSPAPPHAPGWPRSGRPTCRRRRRPPPKPIRSGAADVEDELGGRSSRPRQEGAAGPVGGERHRQEQPRLGQQPADLAVESPRRSSSRPERLVASSSITTPAARTRQRTVFGESGGRHALLDLVDDAPAPAPRSRSRSRPGSTGKAQPEARRPRRRPRRRARPRTPALSIPAST